MLSDQKLESLADDVSEDAYERMPIEDFGKNVLSKLGWKEGQPIGGSNKVLVVPKLYEKRQKGLGLGAKPLSIDQIKGMKEMGKNMHGKRVAREGDPNQPSSKPSEEMKPGSRVYIYKGHHKGLSATVLRIYKPQESGIVGQEDESKVEVTVELDINQNEVTLRKNKIVLESKRKELQDKGIIAKDEDMKDEISFESDRSEDDREEKKR
jgi:hypothetical protein